MNDPYEVLGVSQSATPAEITHAYRLQLRAYHPDRRSTAKNSAADERLRRILDAYALLRDPRRRAAYDSTAGLTRDTSAPVRIRVSHRGSADEQPPLWAGPVRWRRR